MLVDGCAAALCVAALCLRVLLLWLCVLVDAAVCLCLLLLCVLVDAAVYLATCPLAVDAFVVLQLRQVQFQLRLRRRLRCPLHTARFQ